MRYPEVDAVVAAITPFDDIEATHRADALAWIRSGAPIYRVRKPAVPPKHLVAYFPLVDVDAGAVLLVDHRNAQRWLPTGGHVEPGEDPRTTVTRELAEELGIGADAGSGALLAGLTSNPFFVTCTTTGGLDAGHVDVSLWYVVAQRTDCALVPDPGEFAAVRWWTFAEVCAAPPGTLDPNLPRFVEKLRRDLASEPAFDLRDRA